MRVRLVRPSPPDPVTKIARTLEATGRAAWLTGECLADLLSDRAVARFTLATAAPPAEIAGLLPTAVPTAPGGVAWQVPTPAGPVDVLPEPHPQPVEARLRARGLTGWALAWSPIRGELIDPFGGEDDLASGRLCCVGSARDRLAEHPALALAVARLVAQHGARPDEALEGALGQIGRQELDRIPAAFRGRAILALIAGPHAGDAVALLARTRLEQALGVRMPADAPRLLVDAPADLALRLVVWLRGSRPGRFLRRHRIHPELSERVLALLGTHPVERSFSPRRRSSLVRLAGLAPADRSALFWIRAQELAEAADESDSASARRDLAALEGALVDHLEREAARAATPPLAMDGREIMEALGVGPSPLVGRALQYLHEQIAKSPELNRPDPLRTLLARWSERVGDNDSDPSGDATR